VRAIRIVLGVVLALAASLLGAGTGPAQAAPAPTPYPPTCFLIKLSTTTPNPDQTITVTGQDFTSGIDVTVVLDAATVLATTRVDADGSFAVGVTVPAGLTGSHAVSATGDPRLRTGDCPAAAVQITIGTQPASSGGGLASTGLDVALGVAVAVALLAAGLVLARAGRRANRHARS
jgi:hypothetical protein